MAGMGGEMRGYGEMGGDGVWEKVGEGRLGTEPGREGVGVGPREEVYLWLALSPFPLGCLALGSSGVLRALSLPTAQGALFLGFPPGTKPPFRGLQPQLREADVFLEFTQGLNEASGVFCVEQQRHWYASAWRRKSEKIIGSEMCQLSVFNREENIPT